MNEAYLRMTPLSRLPLVRQSTSGECGLSCIAMVAGFLGVGTDLVELRRHNGGNINGATLADLSNICESLGLSTRPVRCRVSELRKLRTPCVLHWQFNHFVVLKSASRGRVVIHDPARGVVKDTYENVRRAFTGVALEISRGSGFRKAKAPPALKLSSLTALDAEFIKKLSAGLVLSLIVELLVLASPFYLQTVIDQVLGQGDVSLLDVLVLGFSALLVFQVVASTMRQLTFQYLSQVSVFDISARVLHKLLRLPLSYFRSRDLGDIQHRIQSLARVQAFIVHSAPALLLDAVFITLLTGLLTIYDAGLTALVLAVTALWCLWRALIFPVSLRLSGDIAIAESSVDTHFLETLRAVQTIKMANGEAARQSEWRNLFADRINAKIRVGNLAVVDSAVRQVLFQGLRILCVYLLAKDVLAGQMSIGMVSAFVAYLGMFMARAGGIVDRLIEYKLLAVPLNRLADVVYGDEETARGRGRTPTSADYCLNMKHAWFRFDNSGRWILRDCSCRIPENGFVAIAGVSGEGKSTLLRLLAGLEPLSEGELSIAGLSVEDWPVQDLRAVTATVFEDDSLLKGTVAENIALFGSGFDLARVQRAAVRACIDREIRQFPMGYQTRIGDLGSSLSKGQAQRILMARALYREPRILLIDEATSGLDYRLEKRVIQTLSTMNATRIAITHSDQMLEAADEVLWLQDGALLRSRPALSAW